MHKDKEERIIAFFRLFQCLKDSEIREFLEFGEIKQLQKFDHFIKEGQVCHKIAFVFSGLIRSYYLSPKGEEMTYCILFPDVFITAYSSFLTQQPTRENMQMLSNAELLVVSKDELEKLTQRNPNWNLIFKAIAEQQYIELEKRIFQLQISDAATRYKDLLDSHPQYVQEIPLQYLASYLGITQRHLSRIRAAF
jgi:CRP-like cAMP-binding protein